MRIKTSALALLAFLLSAAAAFATIGTPLQMQTGNPSNATADTSNHSHFLIQRPQYGMDYSDTLGIPNWVSWDFTPADNGGLDRPPFTPDPGLPTGFYAVVTGDYTGSGFDRGHMSPNADRNATTTDQQAVFYMTNILPQTADNNQGPWAKLETECRRLAGEGNEILNICGPSGFTGAGKITSGKATIPAFTWKIVLVVPNGSGTAKDRITATTRVIAVKMPNTVGIRGNTWESYKTTVATITADTGFAFFSDLTPAIRDALRNAPVDGGTAVGAPSVAAGGQPIAQTAPVGGSATFTVTALDNGNPPLTYQWLFEGEPIAGATNATLTLTNVQAANLGNYSVTITNPIASITSEAAALVITGLPPSITSQPVSRSAAAGSAVTISVGATGSPTLTYQWRKGATNLTNGITASGSVISGATTPNLTLSNVQAGDAANYDVVIANTVLPNVTSTAATLTVTPAAPTIVSHPGNQTVVVAGTTTLTVVATGTAPLTYQWRKGGVALTDGVSGTTGVTVSGATTASLTLTGVAVADSGNYDVVVANGVLPDATSNVAVIAVGAVAPGSQVVYTGGTYTQNFNTLPSAPATTAFTGTGPWDLAAQPTATATTALSGWRVAGTAATLNIVTDAGTSNAGAIHSHGTDNATDRALGSAASGSNTPLFGVMIVNNTGTTITQFTASFTGEQWRNGGNATAQTLPCSYSLGATDINAGTFTDIPALLFTSPIATATAGALDGNAASNRNTTLSTTVTGVSWAPGQTLFLRWTDANDSGNDHALAIDDFTFTTPVGTAPVTPTIASTTPANAAVGVAGNAPISVTFNQPVTVTGSWFAMSSTLNGAFAATVTGGPTTYTLTPPLNFTDNDTVTVTFFASQITESATGTLHPTANTTISFATAAPVAPTVATAPQPVTANAGATATFTVVANGTAPFTYQWRKNGTAITGNSSATTSTLTLPNVQAADAAAGPYDVIVTNSVSSVTSTSAALTVTPAGPTITTAPVATTVLYGANATFTVAASGTEPFTYIWRKGGTPLTNGAVSGAATISGATGKTLTLTGVTDADPGNYDVIVTNSVSSAPATTAVALTVTLPPAGPQTNYSGGTYAQNFDTLPTGGTTTFTGLTAPFTLSAAPSNATGMAGWSLASTSGTPTLIANAGTTTNGAAYSYGTGTATDRALGSQGSGSVVARYGVALFNNTGSTLTTFTLGYTGEQWRRGTLAANKLAFSYATGAIDLNTGTFTNATVLDFTAPVTSVSDTALDGNLAANRVVIAPVTITGVNWAPNTTLTLRWTDTNDSGNDDGISIDDLTFTAVPNILTAPVAQNAISGGTATFTVATNASPVTYQWRKNGTALTGNTSATTATLTLPVVTSTSAGNYDVILTNAAGSTTTTAVALNVATSNVVITIAGTSATYDGTPKPVTVTTAPAGLPVALAYAGSATAPTDAGSYVVTATVSTADATGSASALLTIAKASQTVTLGTLPATVSPGIAFTLTATATSGLPVTLSVASGNATISGNSVTLADTAPVTLRATQSGNNNYAAASADTTVTAGKLAQTIAVTPIPAQLSTAAPIALNATATSGLTVTFSLVSGPATLSGNTLTLTGAAGTVLVRASQAGNATYNAAPDADVSFAVTIGNAAPRITSQPSSQVAQLGATAAFSVVATGSPAPTYQWRKDGVTLAGATAASLALANLTAADAAGYDVVVTNSLGSVTSSLARLTVNATPTAPVITRQPGNVVALAGRSATFTVVATGSPAPTYQWSKGSTAITGATTATLTLASVTAADAGTYTVNVSNSAGSASSSANLRVIARSYAGTYFGTLGNGGRFALRINEDNTGVFLGFVPPGSSTVFVSRAIVVDDNGHFSFVANANVAAAASLTVDPAGSPRVAAAPGDFTFEGNISDSGALTSTSNSVALSATRSSDTGATAATAGFYQAGAAGTSAQTLVIVSPAGQAFVVTQNGANSDAGSGTADATGKIAVTTAAGTVSASVSADTAALTATVTTGGTTTTFTGFAADSAALAQQRIINLSTRTTAGTGDQVAIVGFVIAGLESKPVLLRAVGPALRGLGVTTALAAPRLDLRGATGALLATNTAWGSAGNTAEIANAAARSGAFPLAVGSADSVILTTLAPGAYSAVISASDNLAGVGLVEVYDLSGGSTAQKLANLSTRAAVGSGEATLISGLVVGGSAPKRVLLRAAGPSLAQFGVASSLTRPALTLYSATGTVLAQNSGWSTSADSAAIAEGAARVGAFAFAVGSADAALIVNLAPGAYTAQVTGVAGATGTTLLEVYELP